MPDIPLSNGGVAIVDDEDFAWVIASTWRAWKKAETCPAVPVSDARSKGRRFRRRLLREVAVKAHPRLAALLDRLTVTPRNGDWFDARRSNLEIVVRARVGRPPKAAPRPKGWLASDYKGPDHERSH